MGKAEKTEGRRGFASRRRRRLILSSKPWADVSSKRKPDSRAIEQLQSSPNMHKREGCAKALKNTLRGRDSAQFKLRCAQASLYPCTLLYLCSLDWQKLRVRWAKAILVNSLPFMRRVIPRLFQLSFAWACRDEPRKPSIAASRSFAAENFTLDCFSPPLIWPSVFSCVSFSHTIEWG